MKTQRIELLRRLHSETGVAPRKELPPEAVLRMAKAMVERRAPIIEALAALGPASDPQQLEPTWGDIKTLEEQWAQRIADARASVADQLGNVRRAKRRRGPRAQAVALRRKV